MRTGILDSKEDLELVLVAKELEAILVSSDEGAMKFAKQLGCNILKAEKFLDVLENMEKIKKSTRKKKEKTGKTNSKSKKQKKSK